MDVIRGLAALGRPQRPLFLAIGNFDGVHLGHRALIASLVAEARSAGACPAVMTFDPHVRRVLAPHEPFGLLTTLADRAALMEALGVELLLVIPFDRSFAAVEAEDFAREVLAQRLGVRRLFVGRTFTFGRGGRGTPQLLQELGLRLGFDVRVLEPVRLEGQVVSSTAVRELLAAGDVVRAARFLGRPHVVEGVVVPGAGRGRQLGVPTANVQVAADGPMLPAPGVYAVEACAAASGRAWGVANLGLRPTFADADRPVLEVHLLDREVDLVGATLRVAFVARLRDERRFPDAAALAERIRRDIEEARRLRATPPPTELGDDGWARFLCARALVYARLAL